MQRQETQLAARPGEGQRVLGAAECCRATLVRCDNVPDSEHEPDCRIPRAESIDRDVFQRVRRPTIGKILQVRSAGTEETKPRKL